MTSAHPTPGTPTTPTTSSASASAPATSPRRPRPPPAPPLDTAFYDQQPAFHWHPGALPDDATLPTPFLADLVTLADPTNPWTFLNYLRSHHRLLPFHLARQLHIHRAEYQAYARWVSDHLPGLHFHHHIDSIRWNHELALFEVDHTRHDPHSDTHTHGRTHTRNIALATGTEPHIPDPLKPLVDAPAVPVIHSSDYLHHRDRLRTTPHVTVIGSGQSGAEIFLDLL
ncbi:SidA/IucD/PvdA family monooxygenase, partial [Streptomyces sp. C8S0]